MNWLKFSNYDELIQLNDDKLLIKSSIGIDTRTL